MGLNSDSRIQPKTILSVDERIKEQEKSQREGTISQHALASPFKKKMATVTVNKVSTEETQQVA